MGNDEIMLTSNQIKRIVNSKASGKGSDIKISKTQIRKVMREGGSLFSDIRSHQHDHQLQLQLRRLDYQHQLVQRSEGASQVVRKISGKGMQGGFLIPQNLKIDQLIAYKHLLTNKQKQDILIWASIRKSNSSKTNLNSIRRFSRHVACVN